MKNFEKVYATLRKIAKNPKKGNFINVKLFINLDYDTFNFTSCSKLLDLAFATSLYYRFLSLLSGGKDCTS